MAEQTIDSLLDSQLQISNPFHAMGWRAMIRRSRAYYSMLVKEFYTNMIQKTNKDAITIQTIVKVPYYFDQALISQIAFVPSEGPSITFSSTSTAILGGYKMESCFCILGFG